MDFFAAQDDARKKTRQLLFIFILCIVGVVIFTCALSYLLYLLFFEGLYLINLGFTFLEKVVFEQNVRYLPNGPFFKPIPGQWIAGSAVGTLFVILSSCGVRVLELKKGGEAVADHLDGRLLKPSTCTSQEKRLLNIVEEVAIASGLPVPKIFILDREKGINALAAGTTFGNAAIIVTSGCLSSLKRAELQGVIAHEFAHILNGDMKLNSRLIGWVYGLVAITMIGNRLQGFHFVEIEDQEDHRGGSATFYPLFLLGIGLLIVGSIGSFFACILQAAVYRQREFYADASAVKFTRDPTWLVGALKKIRKEGSKIQTLKALEASHCFFSDDGLFSFGLATHPPIKLRIRRLEGRKNSEEIFDKTTPNSLPAASTTSIEGSFSQLVGGNMLSHPERVEVALGRQIRGSLKEKWNDLIYSNKRAQNLIFGLLITEDSQFQQAQTKYLEKKINIDATEDVLHWHQEVRDLHSTQKIALLELSLPSLRNLSTKEYEQFSTIANQLVEIDGRVDLFEFMLQRLIETHLSTHFKDKKKRPFGTLSVKVLKEEARLLISAFAYLGPGHLANSAFDCGFEHLSLSGQLLSREEVSLTKIDSALKRLDSSSPLTKGKVLQACALVVAFDEKLGVEEIELLRAMADSIGCVIPPFVAELNEVSSANS